MPEAAAITRTFDAPDEHRDFPLGRFDLVQIGGISVGRAESSPGGAGPSTSAPHSARRHAKSRTWAWCWPAETGSR